MRIDLSRITERVTDCQLVRDPAVASRRPPNSRFSRATRRRGARRQAKIRSEARNAPLNAAGMEQGKGQGNFPGSGRVRLPRNRRQDPTLAAVRIADRPLRQGHCRSALMPRRMHPLGLNVLLQHVKPRCHTGAVSDNHPGVMARVKKKEEKGMHESLSFEGQVAIVTGGAQGIGRAVAGRLSDLGARVAIWDIELDMAKQTARSIGRESMAFSVDVADWHSVSAALNETLEAMVRIDVLVNSAGIAGGNANAEDYDIDEFRRVIDINLLGTFHANRAVIPSMRNRDYGRIVNIASIAGKEGNPTASAYSASKAGVIGLTKSLGKELAGHNISVNCVTPAAARTRIFDQMSQEHIDYMLSKIPRGRFLELQEAASMISWLASRENSFTTGGVFDLSGGRATY